MYRRRPESNSKVPLLLKRIIVCAVGIPAGLWIAYRGGIVLLVLVNVIILLGLREYFQLMKPKGLSGHPLFGYATGLVFCNLSFIKRTLGPSEIVHAVTLSLFLLLLLLAMEELRKADMERAPLNVGVTLLGILYVGFCGSFIFELTTLSGQRSHWKFLYTLLICIWLCDTLAFFMGKYAGRIRIYPRVSPNKTLEGCLAGLAGALLGSLICAKIFFGEIPLIHLLGVGFLAGTIGQAGDFWESMLKRYAGAKDSSNLLPGHGGILDRFDSLIFSAPAVYFYLRLVAKV